MTAQRMLPAMDIYHPNEEHDSQYYPAKQRYPNDDSNDPFELFTCPYDSNHKITAKKWHSHLNRDKQNYGGEFISCQFNASHHIPKPEYEYHINTCPDKKIIQQDLEQSSWTMATSVNHHPDWQVPDTGDNWDDEVDDNAAEFSINVDKGMPLAMIPKDVVEQEELYEYYYEDDEDGKTDGIEATTTTSSVLAEELIPEKPSNWNDMSKTQKKNHKRKYERQQQRMQEEGVVQEDFEPEKDPTKWTEKQRVAKLNAIKAGYPMAYEKVNATRVDFTSLLNIVCQKIPLNLPEYKECAPANGGGFAFQCRIKDRTYTGMDYCSTKKDAKHSCAKWALLSMDVPGLDGSNRDSAKPIHPSVLAHSAKLREDDELGRLMAAGAYPQQKQTLRQPRVEKQNNNSPTQSPVKNSQFQPAYSLQEQPPQHQQQQHQPWQQQQQPWQQKQQQPWQQRQQLLGQKTHSAATVTTNMQKMNLANNEDFPSLGGNAWTTVAKKGVSPAAGRARGRGRGTTMKP